MLDSPCKFLPFFLVFSLCAACSQTSDCEMGEFCEDDICHSPFEAIKGDGNTACVDNGYTSSCFCDVGFTGDVKTGCTKLDHDPCEPNPCGPNSVCTQGVFGHFTDKKIGAYCLCKDGFYGKPPNCGTGCETSDDCASNEVCDKSNKCMNYCDPSPCGPNSTCRNDNHSEPRCSCLHGFFPQSGIGCRLKTPNDSRIPLKKIKKRLEMSCDNCTSCTNRCKEANKICVNGKCIPNPCTKYCDSSSNCGIINRTLECYNAFDHNQNPYVQYTPEFQSFDPCEGKSTKPECGVAISEIAIKTLALG